MSQFLSKLHGITNQKTVLFIVMTVRILNQTEVRIYFRHITQLSRVLISYFSLLIIKWKSLKISVMDGVPFLSFYTHRKPSTAEGICSFLVPCRSHKCSIISERISSLICFSGSLKIVQCPETVCDISFHCVSSKILCCIRTQWNLIETVISLGFHNNREFH